jgi:hypothetical protein
MSGSRLFVSMRSLFQTLALEGYKGEYSTWICSQRPRWDRFWHKLLGSGQMVFSTWISSRSSHRKGMSFAERCLPHTSVSLVGLLALLARFAYDDRQTGGLEEKGDNAKQLLSALCGQITSRWDIDIVVADGWLPMWPRPPMRGTSFKLSLSGDNVDLGSFVDAITVAAADDSVCVRWSQELSKIAIAVSGDVSSSVG